jgi:genome maintenance exonuclease 1
MILKSNKMYDHAECPPLPVLTRTNVDGRRHYVTPEGTFISITSLLSWLQPSDSIKSWRARMGNDVADYIMQTAGRRGTRLHKIVELALSNKSLGDVTDHGLLPAALFNSMQPALDRISQIRALEQPLYSTEFSIGIAGQADTVCEFDGIPSVVDFKTATKMRKEEEIQNHLIQCAFYASAWTRQTQLPIKQIVIIMASEDGRMHVFNKSPSAYIPKIWELAGHYTQATLPSLDSVGSIKS